jgi:hypothetical protein
MNDRNIVIPTFLGDQELLDWQFRCFDHFLATPVCIHYILNDLDNSYLRNKIQSLKSQYRTHEIVVTDCDQLDFWHMVPQHTKNHGWASQQLIKLFYPLDSAYLVMDTKDLVLKPCQWVDIFQHHPLLPVKDIPSPFIEFWQAMEKIWEGKPSAHRGISTPQIVDPKVVEKIIWGLGTTDELLKWFGSFMVPAEFLLHDFVQQYNNHYDVTRTAKRIIYRDLRDIHYENKNITQLLEDFESNPCALVLRLHRTMLNDPAQKSIILSWLESKFQP